MYYLTSQQQIWRLNPTEEPRKMTELKSVALCADFQRPELKQMPFLEILSFFL